jgi:hypothetical protein
LLLELLLLHFCPSLLVERVVLVFVFIADIGIGMATLSLIASESNATCVIWSMVLLL